MASILQRLAAALSFTMPVLNVSSLQGGGSSFRTAPTPFGTSHCSVAMDRRKAARTRARKRAKRLGQA